MSVIRREIRIMLEEDIGSDEIGIEVSVPEGLSTIEAIGLMELAKIQHLQSKHKQGPTIYLTPDAS